MPEMKKIHKQSLKSAATLFVIITMMWSILLTEKNSFIDPCQKVGVCAEAAAPYGISGKTAPDLDLDTWIDGSGKSITPISLKELRGKIVYLYFFQDW